MEGVLKDLVRANPDMFRSMLQEMVSNAGPSSSGAVNPSSPELASYPGLEESSLSNSTDHEESELEVPISSASDDDDMQDDSVTTGSGGAPAAASAPAVKVHKYEIHANFFS